MPRLNMDNYDSSKVSSFKVVQPGIYIIKVKDIRVSYSQNSNEMWFVTYEIIEKSSEFFKSFLFDNIVFSEKVYNRVKLIFESFKVDMPSGDRDYIVEDLLGKIGKAQVTHVEEYVNNKGERREKSVIGFDGYFPIEEKEVDLIDEDIPF